jgi:hypothetical protein
VLAMSPIGSLVKPYFSSVHLSFFPSGLTLKPLNMEAVDLSETLINIHQTTRHRIPLDSIIHSHGCEKLLTNVKLSVRKDEED